MSLPVLPQTPTLTVSPSDVTIESGTSISLTCTTASSTGGDVTYSFIKDSSLLVSQASGTYSIDSSTTGDSATYTCTVTINSHTSQASDESTFIVFGGYIILSGGDNVKSYTMPIPKCQC